MFLFVISTMLGVELSEVAVLFAGSHLGFVNCYISSPLCWHGDPHEWRVGLCWPLVNPLILNTHSVNLHGEATKCYWILCYGLLVSFGKVRQGKATAVCSSKLCGHQSWPSLCRLLICFDTRGHISKYLRELLFVRVCRSPMYSPARRI